MPRFAPALLALLSLAFLLPAAVRAGHTEVVTVAISPSTEPAGGNKRPSISGDGRYVAFESTAPNLVSDDTNWASDVFVFDRVLGTTARVSMDSAGLEGNLGSVAPSISSDGRYVAFTSWASNLVSGDTNGVADTFVHDRQTGQTSRVSVDGAALEGNGPSYAPSISSDGRYVAFSSLANNLVTGDTNPAPDIFVHDRQTGQTSRVSVDSTGLEGNSLSDEPSISSDGRYVAFYSYANNLVSGDTNGVTDIFVHDRQSGQTSRVSVDSVGLEANSNSIQPSISPDGRYVAFSSWASNLVSSDTNGWSDIFVHDRQTGQTSRVSLDSAGLEGNGRSYEPSMSADGRYVAFDSHANNLVSGDTNGADDIIVHDRQTGQTSRVSVNSADLEANGPSYEPSISPDGRYVAFSSPANNLNLVTGDTNEDRDVFVHDRQLSTTERTPDVGVPPPPGATWLADAPSALAEGASSHDGRYVAFTSQATNLVLGDTNQADDIFVRDRQTGQTGRASVDSAGEQGVSKSYGPSISSDGRYVAFTSHANNLVSGDTNWSPDVFVHDRQTGQTGRVSVDSAGLEGNADSDAPSISSDGRYVAFTSWAWNLVSGDTNWMGDVFVHDRQTGLTGRVSVDGAGLEGNSNSIQPSISSDGRYVAFASWASNLVSGDTNGTNDIFVHDRQTGLTGRVSVDSAGLEGNDSSYEPSISSDGRYVAFYSSASNLVSGDTNGLPDIFVHDRQAGLTGRVSVDSAGMEGNGMSYGPSISSDGRYVAFTSWASNLVSGDTNGTHDIFVYDRHFGLTSRASLSSNGAQGNGSSEGQPALSGDGRFVAFPSAASNFVPGGDYNGILDLFVRDLSLLFADGFEGGAVDAWHGAAP